MAPTYTSFRPEVGEVSIAIEGSAPWPPPSVTFVKEGAPIVVADAPPTENETMSAAPRTGRAQRAPPPDGGRMQGARRRLARWGSLAEARRGARPPGRRTTARSRGRTASAAAARRAHRRLVGS